MTSTSPWTPVLTAGTTSHALDLATALPTGLLSNTPLPVPAQDLSEAAQANLFVVRRALGVHVDTIPECNYWDTWSDDGRKQNKPLTEANKALKEKPPNQHEVHESSPQERNAHVPSSPGNSSPFKQDSKSANEKTKQAVGPGSLQSTQTKSVKPTPDELRAASLVRDWARQAPHTPAPKQSVSIVSRSTHTRALLSTIVPVDCPAQQLAATISAFTSEAGPAFATEIVKHLLIPYMEKLTSPASREMMLTIVSFASRHWRAVVFLFEWAAQREKAVNGAVAEILVRAGGAVNEEGVMECFRAFCSCRWGEDGLRVVEALLVRCVRKDGVAGSLVAALERNIVGMEKSVRFGKLLFTTSKELPEGTHQYFQAFESVCLRSKVFLAKRALKMTKDRKQTAT